jgi:hypothetical protein
MLHSTVLNKKRRTPNAGFIENFPVKCDRIVELPLGFVPSAFDVICGKGKTAYEHVGNCRFRVTINLNLPAYREATSKLDKSLIVMSVVDMFRSLSPNGGFIKQDHKTGRWYQITDHMCREKVGQTLREALIQQDPDKRAKKRVKRAIRRMKRTEHRQSSSSPKIQRGDSINFGQEQLVGNSPQIDLPKNCPYPFPSISTPTVMGNTLNQASLEPCRRESIVSLDDDVDSLSLDDSESISSSNLSLDDDCSSEDVDDFDLLCFQMPPFPISSS